MNTTNELGADHPVDIDFHLSQRLEDEVPWETVAKVLDHNGWMDLIATIKTVSPVAYEALKRDLLK